MITKEEREPQFKQELYGEFVNDKFYETTIRHKFKQGDKIRLKKTYADHYGKLEFTVDGIEFYRQSDSSEWYTLYQTPDYKIWIAEHKLELVETTKYRIKPQQTSIPATEKELKTINRKTVWIRHKKNLKCMGNVLANNKLIDENWLVFNPDTKCWEDWGGK